MISENKRLEFWNFLTSEKNQPRPKGITTQRLAVIRPQILSLDDLWLKVMDQDDADDSSVADFYGSNEQVAINSRTEFWAAVRNLIRQGENKTIEHQPSNSKNRRRR